MSETRRPNGGPTYEDLVHPVMAQLLTPFAPQDESEADDD